MSLRRSIPSGRTRSGPAPRWMIERSLPGRRLFIATPLPGPVCEAVERLVGDVRSEVAATLRAEGRNPEEEREVRWVRLDGLHVTLRFLGPTLDDRLSGLEAAVRDVAGRVRSFGASLAGGGAFPGPGRPRVLWLGIREGEAGLAALAAALGEALAPFGWEPDDRPFRPHLTLARADGVRSGGLTASALIAAAARFESSWRADRLVLFESHTGGGPARYEPLVEAPLA